MERQALNVSAAHVLLLPCVVCRRSFRYFTRLEQYRLKVHGCVERPLTLTLQQVKDLAGKEHVWTMPLVMECSGNGRAMMKPRYNKHVPWGLQSFGCYCWTGLPLRLLLQQVGVTSDCVDVVFTGYDAGMEHGELRYFQHSLEIHDPIIDYSLVCWMHNGVELIPNHGFPLRLMVPAWYGNANIKWLQSIELVNRRFKGVYQRTYSYSKTNSDNDVSATRNTRNHSPQRSLGHACGHTHICTHTFTSYAVVLLLWLLLLWFRSRARLRSSGPTPF